MNYQIIFLAKHFLLPKFDLNEKGQGLVEYALIIMLVAIVVIGAVRLFGQQLDVAFGNVVNEFERISP